MLSLCVTILETDEEDTEQVVDEQVAFTNVYSPLAHAVKDDHDPFASVDPRIELAKLLAELASKHSVRGGAGERGEEQWRLSAYSRPCANDGWVQIGEMVSRVSGDVQGALKTYGQAAGLPQDFIR